MITITDIRNKTEEFENLEPNETFMYEEGLYVKITDDEEECGGYNAYNLHEGYLDYFPSKAPVINVDVELFIVG